MNNCDYMMRQLETTIVTPLHICPETTPLFHSSVAGWLTQWPCSCSYCIHSFIS